MEVSKYIPESPYVYDLYFPKKRLGIVISNEVSRNIIGGYSFATSSTSSEKRGGADVFFEHLPLGVVYLQTVHLKVLGYSTIVIPPSVWKGLETNLEKSDEVYMQSMNEELKYRQGYAVSSSRKKALTTSCTATSGKLDQKRIEYLSCILRPYL